MSELRPVRHVIETLFRIPNKRGEIVPFKLNNIQADLHDRRTHRMDILKFRQGGVTSFIMAWFLVECMYRYCRCVMIAHDKDHTERLLARAQLMLRLLKGPKPQTSRLNNDEIVFSKTGASFYIGTAGSRNFGRSDTITHLHCSEVAFWKDPKSLMSGLFQAVPHDTGIIVKESTANGAGTYHHAQYLLARSGQSRFTAIFYPWHVFEEYRSRTPLSSPLTPEEQELKEKFGLDDAQIQWRREKLEELDGDVNLFRQEYPMTDDEAFLAKGGTMFPNVKPVSDPRWRRVIPPPFPDSLYFELDGHPVHGYEYVIGADVSGGTGNDYSVAQVLCVHTLEQVAMFRTNMLPPPDFARVLIALGQRYNYAFLVPEANQHGLSVIACIRDSLAYADKLHRLYRMRRHTRASTGPLAVHTYGYTQTQRTKYQLIGTLQRTLPELTLYCPITANELMQFGETEEGKLEALSPDAHDDAVIALALACEGLKHEAMRVHPRYERLPARDPRAIDLDDIRSRLPVRRGRLEWFGRQLEGP